MTRKLYYEDCHLARFTARVTGCAETELVTGGAAKSQTWEVTLDQTAFYPEGGGQACDLGTLGGATVGDVQERGEQIIHLCDAPLEVGAEVEGIIDYARRFDLMQQHSGEHIVSGVVHETYGYHNVGFHMGADVITIDFDGMIPGEDLPVIEAKVNEAVWKNIPLHIWYPSPEELPAVGYRTKRELPWPVRIVEVPGYDKCACCGVHVAYTGEIGLVKLFSVVKFHQGVRIEMACGKRALDHLSAVYDQNRQVSQAFSAKILETGEAARRINDALSREKFKAAGLQRQLFDGVAQRCAGRGDILHFAPDLEPALVRELADRIAETCGGTAAVFSGSDGPGYSFCLAAREGDLRPLCKAMTQALSGRGGGKPNFQQGQVRAAQAQIQAFFDAWQSGAAR